MILDTLAALSKKRALQDEQRLSYNSLVEKAVCMSQAPSFRQALLGYDLSVIAEIKKASPSKGVISQHFNVEEAAGGYEAAGAAAISCLTEPDYFLGKDSYIADVRRSCALPVLRKDFTTSPYQIVQAKVLGASAVLLIAAILKDTELCAMLGLCEALGLSALTEVHDTTELKRAVDAGAQIIGVNNRNLKDFSVNIQTSLLLIPEIPKNVIAVSESGIQTPEDIKKLRHAGADAVLIGEAFMKTDNAGQACREFIVEN